MTTSTASTMTTAIASKPELEPSPGTSSGVIFCPLIMLKELWSRGRRHQEGGYGEPQDRNERLDRRERQTDRQNAEPVLREEYGIRPVHPNPKAMTRKAVAGWRATRRLSVEWVVGWWFSVVVDMICLFLDDRPRLPCACSWAR
jgi:hypothetical protein